MNADDFRYFYDYHFTENRSIWDKYVAPLSQEKFIQDVNYSVGSVRNQLVHMMRVDDNWFKEIQGIDIPDWPDPTTFDREAIRARWDTIEQMMRAYLSNLHDDMLHQKPVPDGEDKDLVLWQILLHVVNHGTDHRAQLLRLLNDLGVKTGPQDFVF